MCACVCRLGGVWLQSTLKARPHTQTGPAQVTLARVCGGNKRLTLDTMLAGTVKTYSNSSWVTDSAAGATSYVCAFVIYVVTGDLVVVALSLPADGVAAVVVVGTAVLRFC